MKTEIYIMASHLRQHTETLNDCIEFVRSFRYKLSSVCGQSLAKLLAKQIDNSQRKLGVLSSRTKNDKIRKLVIDKVVHSERLKNSLPKNTG